MVIWYCTPKSIGLKALRAIRWTFFTPEILEDFLPNSIDAVTVDDKFSAILFFFELLGLYYNEDMVETAGVKPRGTLNELIAVNSVLAKDMIADLLFGPKGYYQNFPRISLPGQGGGNAWTSTASTGPAHY